MKRFTETTKWDDPWFIRLPAGKKLLWLYLCDRCDASGVIDFCAELATVQIGIKVNADALQGFGAERLRELPSGKWQIVKFMPFQYGTVDASCPAHKPVIRLIQSNKLDFPINNLSNRVSDRVLNTLKEKEEDKERGYPIKRPLTKYGFPLPDRCTIDRWGNVLDYTGRTMDVNQVREAAAIP